MPIACAPRLLQRRCTRRGASVDVFLLIPPHVYLGLVLATIVAFLFHAFVGRRQRAGILYWPFGVGGFAAGALMAAPLGATYLMIGGLPVLAALLGGILGVAIAHVLLS